MKHFVVEWREENKTYITRINKAYKLVPDKLGRFDYYDINKPIL